MQIRLEHIRLAKSLRLEDIAARLGVAVSTIQRYEKGDMSIPSLKLEAVAEAYGVRIGEIFEAPADDAHLSNVIKMWGRIAEIDRERAERAVAVFVQEERNAG